MNPYKKNSQNFDTKIALLKANIKDKDVEIATSTDIVVNMQPCLKSKFIVS